MSGSEQDKAGRDYRVNALGRVSLPPKAFEGGANLRDLLYGKVQPRVIERLDRLPMPDKEGKRDLRQDLMLELLKATASTNVSFQERVFQEEPVEEDVITFSIDEAGDVTILLG